VPSTTTIRIAVTKHAIKSFEIAIEAHKALAPNNIDVSLYKMQRAGLESMLADLREQLADLEQVVWNDSEKK